MSKLKETLNNFKNILSADDKVKAVTEMPVVMADAVAQDQVTDKDEEDKMKDAKKDADEFVKDYEDKDRKTFKASKEMKNLKLGESKLNEEAGYEILWKPSNREYPRIIKDGYGFGIEDQGGYHVNRFIIDNDGKARYDSVPSKYLKDKIDRLIKRGAFDNPHYKGDDAKFVGNTLKYHQGVEESTRSAKVYNPYNYTIQELRIDDDAKTFERGNFTMGKADRKFRNKQEYEDFVDKLKKDGYTEIKSDYKSLRNKTRKGIPTMESVKMNKKLTLDESLFTDYKKHSKVFKESVLNKRRKSLNESKKTLKEDFNVSDIRYAVDSEGESWVVKPIYRGEKLATLYLDSDEEGGHFKLPLYDLYDMYTLLDRDGTVISEPSFDESLKDEKNPLDGIRSNTLEFPNGEYMYIGHEDGKLYAGGATNTGIFHEYEIDYDEDDSVDGNIERLYDTIIEEKPELLEEGCGKKSLKEAKKKKSGYDVYTLVYDCLIGGLKDDEKRPNIAETDKRVKVDDFVATKNDDVVIKTEDPEVIAYVNKIADILNLPVKEGEGTIGIELNAKTSEMPIEDFVEEMGIETPIKYVNVQYERRKAAKANK